MGDGRQGSGAKAPGRRRRRRGRRLRWIAKILVPIAVISTAALLFVYVEVTSQFEGRRRMAPSRIYSDALTLEPGEPVSQAALVRRLVRSGYAASESPPARPGQYRRRGSTLDVHLRSFEAPARSIAARRAVIRFDARGIAAITDERGRWIGRVDIEPEVIATLHGSRHEERELIELDRVPEGFLKALLAAEDARFYQHHGLDPLAIVRAGLANVRKGRIVQGGSTITQQTVKNLYLGQERTWWRKIREALMAAMIEWRYSKDRILEVYVNEVYMGQRGPVAICGVQTAARFFFGRDLVDLSVAEWALLAGLIRNPGGYNPFVHGQAAVARRNQVLDAMLILGSLDPREAEKAKEEPLQLASGGGSLRAPYAVDFVRAQLASLMSSTGLEAAGLRVFTTIDTRLQESAEEALQAGLARLERQVPSIRRQRTERTIQGSLLALDPRTGSVRAMVGGRDYAASQFNRAVQARRQPGSCFKPFVYLAAFDLLESTGGAGLTPASILQDEPLEIRSGGKPWRPENYDGRFRGPVSAREALEHSLNIPTVRASQEAGLDHVVEVARRCGFAADVRPLPSLALGAQEVSALELATAYGVLANAGRRVVPWVVREVVGPDGRAGAAPRPEATRAVSAESAYLVTDILRGVLSRGTGASARALGFTGEAAGKTGTTDDTRDAWFVGYTPRLLALVWVGYDDNARTGLTGATGALPIWVDFMLRAGSGMGDGSFAEPDGIVRAMIDPESGGLAVAKCPRAVEEVFAAGTEPTEDCPLHDTGLFRWFRKLFRGNRSGPPEA